MQLYIELRVSIELNANKWYVYIDFKQDGAISALSGLPLKVGDLFTSR